MSPFVPKVVVLAVSDRVRELIELMSAAWPGVTRAGSADEALAAVEGGANLLIADQQRFQALDEQALGRLRRAARAGALGVMLLTPTAQASRTPPELVEVALSLSSSPGEVLRALHQLVVARLVPSAIRCRLPVQLSGEGGRCLGGELLELNGPSAWVQVSQALPVGSTGRLLFLTKEGPRHVSFAVAGAAPSGAGVRLALRLETVYALWSEVQAAPRLGEAKGSAQRLLVVDDSELLNRITTSVLEKEGYQVKCITNPFEITLATKQHKPDLILVDFNIPSLRGDKLIELTRRAGVATPMVLYSNVPEAVLAEAAQRSGARGYLQKGVEPAQLCQNLKHLLGRLKDAPG